MLNDAKVCVGSNTISQVLLLLFTMGNCEMIQDKIKGTMLSLK